MAIGSVQSQLESYLSLTMQRQTVLASNMANVDTPGYKTKDIDFQSEMARALAAPDGSTSEASPHAVTGLMERPDGNNVDIDRESVLMAETQLQYQLGTQLLKGNFHTLLAAINGGS